MKERPILFSAPMVRSLLRPVNPKTQTRRIVKIPEWLFDECDGPIGKETIRKNIDCPYGQPGDRLWVRETWAYVPVTAYRCSEGVQQITDPNDRDMAAVYAADWERSAPGRWRPSIHMPRWASRITLEITGVRVERLQEISEEDARAEGLSFVADGGSRYGIPGMASTWNNDPRQSYRALWDSINGKHQPRPGITSLAHSWRANPWVWVVEFKRVQPT